MWQVLFKILLTFSTAFLTAGVVWAGDNGKARILFIGNTNKDQYGTHMYMHTCTMLVKCAESLPGVEGIVSDGWPKDPKVLEGVKAICFYCRPVPSMLLEGSHQAAFEALMKRGVGLVTLHFACATSKKNLDRFPAWLDYVGGTWYGGDTSRSKAPLKQLLADHPLNRGWKEFEVEDEIYLNPVIQGGKPALQIKERNGTDVVVGWVHERVNGGRSFNTTLGHYYKNFQNENFRRMIMNGVLWTARVEVPPQGASVKVAEEFLALPPKNGYYR